MSFLSQFNSVCNLQSYFTFAYSTVLPSGLFPSILATEVSYASLPCMLHVLRNWFQHDNVERRAVQIVKLLTMQFCPSSCHIFPLVQIFSLVPSVSLLLLERETSLRLYNVVKQTEDVLLIMIVTMHWVADKMYMCRSPCNIAILRNSDFFYIYFRIFASVCLSILHHLLCLKKLITSPNIHLLTTKL